MKHYLSHTVMAWILFGLGAMVYLLGRDTSVLVIGTIFSNPIHLQYPLPAWVRYNLPDGLWLLGSLQLMQSIWQSSLKADAVKWYAGVIGLALGSEITQYFFPCCGTFDLYDVFSYILAIIVSFTLI